MAKNTHCIVCGTVLTGRQQKFCSAKCQQRHKRQKSKQPKQGQHGDRHGAKHGDTAQAITELVPLDRLREAESQIEVVTAAARVVTVERDKLQSTVDQMTNDLRTLERENGTLIGKLETVEGELKAAREAAENASVVPQQNSSLLLNIALTVVLVGIVLVVAGLFLGWFG